MSPRDSTAPGVSLSINPSDWIRRLGDASRVALSRGLTRAANKVSREAKINAPIETGTLRRAISVVPERPTDEVFVGVPDDRAAGDPPAGPWEDKRGHSHFGHAPAGEYAGVIEAEQPFLAPALEDSAREIEDLIGREIRREIERLSR